MEEDVVINEIIDYTDYLQVIISDMSVLSRIESLLQIIIGFLLVFVVVTLVRYAIKFFDEFI